MILMEQHDYVIDARLWEQEVMLTKKHHHQTQEWKIEVQTYWVHIYREIHFR